MKARALTGIMLALCEALPALAGWRAVVYLGGAASRQSDLFIRQPERATELELRGVNWKGESFTPPLYYGCRLGYFFGPFGLEAEFVHQKIYARSGRLVEARGALRGAPVQERVPMETLVRQFSISHGLNLLVANLVWERKLSPRTFLQLRLGAGPTIPHPESEIQGEGFQHYQLGRPALQAAAGFEYRLWRGLHALTEYKFTRTRQKVDVAAGYAETLVRSHHGVFGLGFRF
ncbi:MAG: hypothetical protein ACP5U2_04510 [Bryobacteraceae bacterium]